jgi:uncharacterized protein (DUF302 family)
METKLGLILRLQTDFAGAVAQVTEALKSEGFGILTEIDVKETMKKKLGAEYSPFKILGACNPNLAHRALSITPEIGLLLPCNVVVREVAEKQIEVSIFNPLVMMNVVDKPELGEIAREARAKLEKVAAALQA